MILFEKLLFFLIIIENFCGTNVLLLEIPEFEVNSYAIPFFLCHIEK